MLQSPVIEAGAAVLDVRPSPVAATGAYSPHAPLPQVSRPHPCREAMIYSPYAILKIAAVASAAGNVIVNVPEVEVLTPPKSKTQQAALVVKPVTVELL